jgi:parallel beta-helix repeat protein
MRWIRLRTAVVGLVTVVVVLTIALGSWQGWLAQAAPDTVYVNDNLLPDVDGCNAPDANTIADGITAADPGDTVVVCEGVYEGGITVDKSVTIEGREGADRADVLLEVDPASPTFGLSIEADNVTIRHLTLDGPAGTRTGIVVPHPGSSDLTIGDAEITDWQYGISTDSAGDMVIEGSYIHDNSNTGVELYVGQGNVLRGNQVTDNDEGLYVLGEDQLLVEGNTLSSNAVVQLLIDDYEVNMRIFRNDIVTVTGSDGIQIFDVPAEALIQIGGSAENANTFSGPFGGPDYYVEQDCAAENTVDATYNWWGSTVRTEIASRIGNDEDSGGGECTLPHDGSVVFHPWATEPAPTPSPSPTPTPSPSPSPTPSTRDFDLQMGWNNFVWTGASGTDPATVLNCIDGSYAIAYRFVAVGQTFERYVPGDAVLSNMTNLDKYDSLLVLVTASGVQCLGMPVDP